MSEVDEFLNALPDQNRRDQAMQLKSIFDEVTGWNARLSNGRTVGYGSYTYTYESGRSGVSFATGFAPLKTKFSIHILPGYEAFSDITQRLGKAKYGASCVYVNKLEDIDLDVLPELIRAGLKRLDGIWPVTPS